MMKNKIATLILFVFSYPLIAQTLITAELGSISRTVPLIGLNTNAHHTTATYTVQSFLDSTAYLAPAILRYPGGSTANYWDWQTGWFMSGITLPPGLGNLPQIDVSTSKFKLALDAVECKGLFVMNLQNSNISYQMQWLRHIDSLNIPLNFLEIGNEHNLSMDSLSSSYYSSQSKIWCDSIKSEFPNSKICLVGGAPPNRADWHDSIFAYSPDFDALAFHVYLGAGNSDSVFYAARALAEPFRVLENRFNLAGFNDIPDSIEVWVTEFNLWEQGNSGPEQFATTWVHALFVTAMNHIFMKNPKITMLINHNLTNIKHFAAIDVTDHHLMANGAAVKLFSEISRGLDSAIIISFNPDPQITINSTSYSKLIGWKFKSETEVNGLICNLSSDTFYVSLADAGFFTEINYDQYSADTMLIVNSLSSLNKISGTSSDSILIYPYSITQLRSTNEPLLVELSLFFADVKENIVSLRWRTETELHNYGFEIERKRKEEPVWSLIGFVPGNGNKYSVIEYSYRDEITGGSGLYQYRLKQIDSGGSYKYYDEMEVEIYSPAKFELLQNYPNPFNPQTNFGFRISNLEFVTLKVYDVLGKEIAELINKEMQPGFYEINWDAASLASGVYFYHLKTKTNSALKKMILIR
jgi:hypothetical protein